MKYICDRPYIYAIGKNDSFWFMSTRGSIKSPATFPWGGTEYRVPDLTVILLNMKLVKESTHDD